MTQGLGFVLAMLVESTAAGALGWWLGPRLKRSRLVASFRCCLASIVGTGVTHPALWLWFSRWLGIAGSPWAGTLSALCLIILVESLFYAAALRGPWRYALGLSATANLISFSAAPLINSLLVRPS